MVSLHKICVFAFVSVIDSRAGDVSLLPTGHDAWVVGKEPVIVVDFQGMIDYAKGSLS